MVQMSYRPSYWAMGSFRSSCSLAKDGMPRSSGSHLQSPHPTTLALMPQSIDIDVEQQFLCLAAVLLDRNTQGPAQYSTGHISDVQVPTRSEVCSCWLPTQYAKVYKEVSDCQRASFTLWSPPLPALEALFHRGPADLWAALQHHRGPCSGQPLDPPQQCAHPAGPAFPLPAAGIPQHHQTLEPCTINSVPCSCQPRLHCKQHTQFDIVLNNMRDTSWHANLLLTCKSLTGIPALSRWGHPCPRHNPR